MNILGAWEREGNCGTESEVLVGANDLDHVLDFCVAF